MSMDLLKCLLCNPDDQVRISGTDEDRRIIQECLANIDAELAEAQLEIKALHEKNKQHAQAYERSNNKLCQLHTDALREIRYLRICPRPSKPHHLEEKKLVQWEFDVEHYETYLESNPPADFK